MTKLSLFFELIKDNSWHSTNELSKALNVPPDRLKQMSEFLAKHDIITYNQNTEQVKINTQWKILCG